MTESQGQRWSDDEKRAVCREAVEGTDPVSHVAKRHGIRKARLYYWLKDPRFNRAVEDKAIEPTKAGFISVRIEEENTPPPIATSPETAQDTADPRCLGIRLAGGHEVFLSGTVSVEVIAQVLRELRA